MHFAMTRLAVVGMLFLILGPMAVQALHRGQSPEAVQRELGEPNGIRQLAGGEVWVYSGDITLEFQEGQLVRAKGLDLLEPPPVASGTMEAEPQSAAPQAEQDPSPGAPDPVRDAPAPDAGLSDLDPDADDFGLEPWEDVLEESVPPTPSLMTGILGWVIPVIIQFVFLLIAFKWVGAEAMKGALLAIAVADKAVTDGVQWFFLSFLQFPTTLHADTLVSFIVMLGMVTTLTHAKRLPTAIKVVVASKVAALVAGYLVLLFALHQMG